MDDQIEPLLAAMPLFEQLDAEQRRWVSERSELRDVPAGAVLVEEGGAPTGFWLLVDGELEVRRSIDGVETRMGGGDVTGMWLGVIPYVYDVSLVTGLTTRPSRLLHLDHDVMREMIDRGFPIARHLLLGVTTGIERYSQRVADRERLAALGRLSAGLAHELNNPASAVGRAVQQASRLVGEVEAATAAFVIQRHTHDGTAPDLASLAATMDRRRAERPSLSGLRRTEAEDAIADRLAELGDEDPDGDAPVFVDVGLDVDCVNELVADAAGDLADPRAAITWLTRRAELTTSLSEATMATARITDLVGKVKEYAHRDQAPVGDVDVRRGIDDTLAVLRARLDGIDVMVDYADELPIVVGSGGELNQVWTNLIDNAADAVAGEAAGGRITITVVPEDASVVVSVVDDGPGIPPELRSQLFEPFFTTKAVGHGTGLGLHLARRIVEAHRGTLELDSAPGRTEARVVLPAGRR